MSDDGSRGLHVGIIMDGNGRWARARGRPREWGHRVGARRVRGIVEAAPDLGIDTLTLYAFSSDNWARPRREVRALLNLFRRYLKSEVPDLVEKGVRLRVVGRRDRLPDDLVKAIRGAERATEAGTRLTLRLAVDYSARHTLAAAARLAAERNLEVDRDTLRALLGEVMHDEGPVRDLDLLIRTGGEQRLSDFLLWESAYAELYFTSTMWPEFDAQALAAAVRDFHGRERRFGKVAAAV